MSHPLHVFPPISLHELTPITDAYQWNAHDHLEWTILNSSSMFFLATQFSQSLSDEEKSLWFANCPYCSLYIPNWLENIT